MTDTTNAENAGAGRAPDVASLSFEQAQLELEAIVERLEDQHVGLDEALSLWERGEALHAHCQRKLDYAAERIQRLQVSPEEVARVTAESGDDFAHTGAPAEQPTAAAQQPADPPAAGSPPEPAPQPQQAAREQQQSPVAATRRQPSTTPPAPDPVDEVPTIF